MFKHIEQKLIQHYQAYATKTLFIAYSGGVDSQVLLHATAKLINENKIVNTLAVCHIHHGLSVYADEWLDFAKKQSVTYQANFYFERVQLSNKQGESLEALARNARYHALTNMTKANDIIITGHHNDDQAETFLLALKRGSGLAGLSAMAPVIQFNERLLVRPLLSISRTDIEDYARYYQLSWVEDESNKDDTFDRNFLRNQVLPLLNQRWPAIKQTISRSAEHCQDAAALINEITDVDFKSCIEQLPDTECIHSDFNIKPSKLLVSKLLELSVLRFNYVIRYFLKLHKGLMPSQQQLSELHTQLEAPKDKTPELKIGNLWLRRYQGLLYVTSDFSDVSDWKMNISLSELNKSTPLTFDLPDGLGKAIITKGAHGNDIHCINNKAVDTFKRSDVLNFTLPVESKLTLSFKHNNPSCLPEYRHKSRTLKKVLQELNISPWLRKRQLFIFSQGEFVGIAGVFICKPYSVDHTDMQSYSIYLYRNS